MDIPLPASTRGLACGSIPVPAGIEPRPEHDEQRPLPVAAYPQGMRRLVNTEEHAVDEVSVGTERHGSMLARTRSPGHAT